MPFDQELPAHQLAGLVDAAAIAHDLDHSIVEAILAGGDENEDVKRIADAFRFHPTWVRRRPESRFGSMLTVDGESTRLVPLTDVNEQTCALWCRVSAHVIEHRSIARLNDLLFERRFGDVRVHAQRAAHAYLEIADAEHPPTLSTVGALSRSLDLARLTNDTDLADRAIVDLVRASAESLDDPEAKPGIALTLLEALVDDRSTPTEVDQLLVRARLVFTDPWMTEHTIAMQTRRATSADARKQLDRELVEVWLDAADRADPLVGMMHRQTGIRLARDRGLPDLVDRGTQAMQSAEPPELVRVQVEIPSRITDQDYEAMLNSLIGDTWIESVGRILLNGPPTGQTPHNRQLANDLASQYPLQGLFPKVRIGGDGLPRYSPTSDDDRLDDQIVDVETMALHIQGPMLAAGLHRAGSRFSPSVEAITEALQRPTFDEDSARAVGRVLHRFNIGDFDGATYMGLPLIERFCRELLLALDAPIYRTQRNRTPGTYPGLGALLPLLTARGFDESWARFLRTFLCAPNGYNYRNEVLHGFVDEVNVVMAGLVAIAVLFLATVALSDEASGSHQ